MRCNKRSAEDQQWFNKTSRCQTNKGRRYKYENQEGKTGTVLYSCFNGEFYLFTFDFCVVS